MHEPGNSSRPILVPVDFSRHSAAALVWAARLAAIVDFPLEVLHVAHDPESAPGYYAPTKRKKHLHRLEEAAEEMMGEFLANLADGHPELERLRGLEGTIVVGLPVNRILEVAAASAAQMIVMGSSGRTGLPHFLLGSKAERVVQLAPLPVTIVKADLEDDADS